MVKFSITQFEKLFQSFGLSEEASSIAVDVLLVRMHQPNLEPDFAVASAPFNPYHEIIGIQHPLNGRGAPADIFDDLRVCLKFTVGCGHFSLQRAFYILDVYKLGKVSRHGFELSLRRHFKWKKSTAETLQLFAEIDRNEKGYFTMSEWIVKLGSLA